MSVFPLNFPISVLSIIVFTVFQIQKLGIILDFLPSYNLPLQVPHYLLGFPGGKELGYPGVKNPPDSEGDVRDAGPIPGSGRFPEGEHGNPLQCSCPETPMDRRAWRATSTGSQRVRSEVRQHTHSICGRQNDGTSLPPAEEVHDLIPESCDYLMLHGKGKPGIENGIKVVNQLSAK